MLQDDNIEVYSTHNEGKSVVAERFIRILRNKIYKCMTSISQNVCTYKLNIVKSTIVYKELLKWSLMTQSQALILAVV